MRRFKTTILIRNDIKHAWFSYRGGNGDKYKIGYAVSKERKKCLGYEINENTIFTSNEGWDNWKWLSIHLFSSIKKKFLCLQW